MLSSTGTRKPADTALNFFPAGMSEPSCCGCKARPWPRGSIPAWAGPSRRGACCEPAGAGRPLVAPPRARRVSSGIRRSGHSGRCPGRTPERLQLLASRPSFDSLFRRLRPRPNPAPRPSSFGAIAEAESSGFHGKRFSKRWARWPGKRGRPQGFQDRKRCGRKRRRDGGPAGAARSGTD